MRGDIRSLLTWCTMVRFQSETLRRAIARRTSAPPAVYRRIESLRSVFDSLLGDLEQRVQSLVEAHDELTEHPAESGRTGAHEP